MLALVLLLLANALLLVACGGGADELSMELRPSATQGTAQALTALHYAEVRLPPPNPDAASQSLIDTFPSQGD